MIHAPKNHGPYHWCVCGWMGAKPSLFFPSLRSVEAHVRAAKKRRKPGRRKP